MIRSVKFKDHYELPVEKESHKTFKTKTIKPTRYSREKEPFDVFYLFEKNWEIGLLPGINIMVGENGTGKTSFIHLLKNYLADIDNNYIEVDGEFTVENSIFFDGEKDNPVTALRDMINPMSKDFINLSAQFWFAQEESHGESMIPLLEYILGNAVNKIIFLDEPETALSLKNQLWLAKIIRECGERGNQIIASTHSLVLINEFDTLLDMETRRYVMRKEYVENCYKLLK